VLLDGGGPDQSGEHTAQHLEARLCLAVTPHPLFSSGAL
jgi:hypothetical protein